MTGRANAWREMAGDVVEAGMKPQTMKRAWICIQNNDESKILIRDIKHVTCILERLLLDLLALALSGRGRTWQQGDELTQSFRNRGDTSLNRWKGSEREE